MADHICKIVFDCRRSWSGPEWLARTLAAYLDEAFIPMSEDWIADNLDVVRKVSFVFPTTDVADRFSDLLSGQGSQVDLTAASPCEMQELYKAAKFAQTHLKRPSEWAEPDAAKEFIIAFDQFLNLLQSDIRASSLA